MRANPAKRWKAYPAGSSTMAKVADARPNARAASATRKPRVRTKNVTIKFMTRRSAWNTRMVAAHNAAAERTQFAKARLRRRYLDAAINRASQAAGVRKRITARHA